MSTNQNLNVPRIHVNNERYTLLIDIEKELIHYKEHFKDKVVYCNCDAPGQSAFWEYFHLNFAVLGLKELIATHYNCRGEASCRMEYTGGNDADIMSGSMFPLKGDGDFQSDECIEILKEADIVVSNCPFSLARKYIAQLFEYDKKFLIVGDLNWVTYKEVFPLFKDNRMWFGYNTIPRFLQPDGKLKNYGNKLWFTNLDIPKRHENLVLSKHYDPDIYPKYDHYDAINVKKVAEIPMDYNGVMAVPISFLHYYNPDQFEILEGSNRYGILNTWGKNDIIRQTRSHGNDINGKATYFRVHIRKIHTV